MSEFHFSPRPNRAGEIAWRQWGEKAFQEAQVADKPVLLAISAVWCHWCHVMDETSYSDPEVIRQINERYVPIRVDNDQRPDVNRRYNMGGWPTTAFLTPDGEIIHGGTYIPPQAMRAYLGEVAEIWREQRTEVTQRLAEMREKEREARAAKPGDLSWEIVDAVASILRGQYDPQYGGFGREPKFPQPRILRFLLGEYRRHRYPEVATMLHKTLAAMAQGGMFDRVEGGFFRYATTRQWEIPHFEKMLEDNAELLTAYAEAHRTFPTAGYDRVVRDVIRWMDATLWRDDVQAFAGSQDADEHYYALDAAARAKHGAPYVDRTVYTSWNALAASAYYAAATALEDPRLDERASATLRGLQDTLRVGGSLMHFAAPAKPPGIPDLLGDLAAWAAALLDAYETGRHGAALGFATDAAGRMRELLLDKEAGGFFDAPEREEPGRVARRDKPIEENALAADALLRLAVHTGDEAWRDTALRTLRVFANEYRQWGQFAAAYAEAVARALSEPVSVTLVAPQEDPGGAALWRAVRGFDHPAVVTRWVFAENSEGLGRLGFPADRVAAYVCVGTVCSAPLTDEASLASTLGEAAEKAVRER